MDSGRSVGVPPGGDAPFERFLSAAIAAIITLMFSWRLLADRVERENVSYPYKQLYDVRTPRGQADGHEEAYQQYHQSHKHSESTVHQEQLEESNVSVVASSSKRISLSREELEEIVETLNNTNTEQSSGISISLVNSSDSCANESRDYVSDTVDTCPRSATGGHSLRVTGLGCDLKSRELSRTLAYTKYTPLDLNQSCASERGENEIIAERQHLAITPDARSESELLRIYGSIDTADSSETDSSSESYSGDVTGYTLAEIEDGLSSHSSSDDEDHEICGHYDAMTSQPCSVTMTHFRRTGHHDDINDDLREIITLDDEEREAILKRFQCTAGDGYMYSYDEIIPAVLESDDECSMYRSGILETIEEEEEDSNNENSNDCIDKYEHIFSKGKTSSKRTRPPLSNDTSEDHSPQNNSSISDFVYGKHNTFLDSAPAAESSKLTGDVYSDNTNNSGYDEQLIPRVLDISLADDFLSTRCLDGEDDGAFSDSVSESTETSADTVKFVYKDNDAYLDDSSSDEIVLIYGPGDNNNTTEITDLESSDLNKNPGILRPISSDGSSDDEFIYITNFGRNVDTGTNENSNNLLNSLNLSRESTNEIGFANKNKSLGKWETTFDLAQINSGEEEDNEQFECDFDEDGLFSNDTHSPSPPCQPYDDAPSSDALHTRPTSFKFVKIKDIQMEYSERRYVLDKLDTKGEARALSPYPDIQEPDVSEGGDDINNRPYDTSSDSNYTMASGNLNGVSTNITNAGDNRHDMFNFIQEIGHSFDKELDNLYSVNLTSERYRYEDDDNTSPFDSSLDRERINQANYSSENNNLSFVEKDSGIESPVLLSYGSDPRESGYLPLRNDKSDEFEDEPIKSSQSDGSIYSPTSDHGETSPHHSYKMYDNSRTQHIYTCVNESQGATEAAIDNVHLEIPGSNKDIDSSFRTLSTGVSPGDSNDSLLNDQGDFENRTRTDLNMSIISSDLSTNATRDSIDNVTGTPSVPTGAIVHHHQQYYPTEMECNIKRPSTSIFQPETAVFSQCGVGALDTATATRQQTRVADSLLGTTEQDSSTNGNVDTFGSNISSVKRQLYLEEPEAYSMDDGISSFNNISFESGNRYVQLDSEHAGAPNLCYESVRLPVATTPNWNSWSTNRLAILEYQPLSDSRTTEHTANYQHGDEQFADDLGVENNNSELGHISSNNINARAVDGGQLKRLIDVYHKSSPVAANKTLEYVKQRMAINRSPSLISANHCSNEAAQNVNTPCTSAQLHSSSPDFEIRRPYKSVLQRAVSPDSEYRAKTPPVDHVILNVPKIRRQIVSSRERFFSEGSLHSDLSDISYQDQFAHYQHEGSPTRSPLGVDNHRDQLAHGSHSSTPKRYWVADINRLYSPRPRHPSGKPNIDELHENCILSPQRLALLKSKAFSIESLPRSVSKQASASSLIETDLDTGVTSESPLLVETPTSTDVDLSFNFQFLPEKTRSMMDLSAGRAKFVAKRYKRDKTSKSKSLQGLGSSTPSLETDIDEPFPESGSGSGMIRIPSVHELRVSKSLQKLNVPDWYRTSSIKRTGSEFLFLRRESSVSSLSQWSNKSYGPLFTRYDSRDSSMMTVGSASPVVIRTRVLTPTMKLLGQAQIRNLNKTSEEHGQQQHRDKPDGIEVARRIYLPSAKFRDREKPRELKQITILPFQQLRAKFELPKKKVKDDPPLLTKTKDDHRSTSPSVRIVEPGESSELNNNQNYSQKVQKVPSFTLPGDSVNRVHVERKTIGEDKERSHSPPTPIDHTKKWSPRPILKKQTSEPVQPYNENDGKTRNPVTREGSFTSGSTRPKIKVTLHTSDLPPSVAHSSEKRTVVKKEQLIPRYTKHSLKEFTFDSIDSAAEFDKEMSDGSPCSSEPTSPAYVVENNATTNSHDKQQVRLEPTPQKVEEKPSSPKRGFFNALKFFERSANSKQNSAPEVSHDKIKKPNSSKETVSSNSTANSYQNSSVNTDLGLSYSVSIDKTDYIDKNTSVMDNKSTPVSRDTVPETSDMPNGDNSIPCPKQRTFTPSTPDPSTHVPDVNTHVTEVNTEPWNNTLIQYTDRDVPVAAVRTRISSSRDSSSPSDGATDYKPPITPRSTVHTPFSRPVSNSTPNKTADPVNNVPKDIPLLRDTAGSSTLPVADGVSSSSSSQSKLVPKRERSNKFAALLKRFKGKNMHGDSNRLHDDINVNNSNSNDVMSVELVLDLDGDCSVSSSSSACQKYEAQSGFNLPVFLQKPLSDAHARPGVYDERGAVQRCEQMTSHRHAKSREILDPWQPDESLFISEFNDKIANNNNNSNTTNTSDCYVHGNSFESPPINACSTTHTSTATLSMTTAHKTNQSTTSVQTNTGSSSVAAGSDQATTGRTSSTMHRDVSLEEVLDSLLALEKTRYSTYSSDSSTPFSF